MTEFEKYIADSLSETELDTLSEQLIVAKLERDKRKEWESKLKKDYNVTRALPKRSLLDRNQGLILRSVAAVLFLVVSVHFIVRYYSDLGYIQFVDGEIKELSIMSDQSVLRKGKKETNAVRSEASLAYSNGDYARSIRQWEQISALKQMNTSDYFYLGICYLKKEPTEPEKTIKWLQKVKASDKQLYKEEIAWILSLAYLKIGENDKATKELTKIVAKKGYKNKDAKRILDLLKQ